MVNLEFSTQSLQEQVRQTLRSWGDAIVSKDFQTLMNLYDYHAHFKPTLSQHIRRNKDEILSYFIGGKKFNDSGLLHQEIKKIEFVESHPQIYGAFAIDVGKYKFIKKDEKTIHAIYTFLFQYIDEKLKIIAHHSSID